MTTTKSSKIKSTPPQKTLLDKIFDPEIDIIFGHNKKRDQSIIFLKKKEFDMFYSRKHRYPLLVKETVTVNTGKPGANESVIDRRLIEDPFQEDREIPQKYSMTLLDYEKYMVYGGSMGHNAPAGQHKTNMDVYSETFLLTNISPQDIVLNTGLWALIENWCKNLARNNKLTNITVFTGNIPALKPTRFPCGLVMNIPVKMFKIVTFNHIDYGDKLFYDIFITNNAPYYINPLLNKFNLVRYLVPVKSLAWFQNFTGINCKALLKFYGLTGELTSMRDMVRMDIGLNDSLRLLMKKSNWFGKIAYARTIDELETVWSECGKLADEFGTLDFHREYYDLTKMRLLSTGEGRSGRISSSVISKTIKRNRLFVDSLAVIPNTSTRTRKPGTRKMKTVTK